MMQLLKNNMKIAIVCYPTFGGSGIVATELGIWLSKKGYEIHFITYKQPVRLEVLNDNLHFHEVQVPSYPLFYYQPYEIALSSKLVDIIKTYKIDIIHVHYAIPHAYAAYMAKEMLRKQNIKVSLLTTLHGTDITLVGSHPLYKPAVEYSINNSDYVTSVSESLKQDTQNLFNITKPIEVVPNFIEINTESKNKKNNPFFSENEKIITHVSNFRPVKRVLDVIKVFERIQKEIPAKLIMVGDGPEKQKALKYCKEKQIDKKVFFLGENNQIKEVLSFSDLFLLLSEKESFGLVALEAMSMGVPVVSTNVGGLPELNIDNYSGFLCNVGDIEYTSAKSLEILRNKNTLNLFKKQAKLTAEKFDSKIIINKYIEIYNKLLM